MEYRRLKGTGLSVSRVCLGAMTFGGQTGEEEALRMVDHAAEHGVNFIDTADSYTGGRSEIITGKAIAGRRHDFIVASKVCRATAPPPNEGGLSRRHILYSIDQTLKRLGTDYVDIYYAHFPDRNTPMEETMDVMSELVRQCKVRYVGMSNHASWQVADAVRVCEKNHGVKPVISENVYNLFTTTVESELVECLDYYKMDMVIYNPLAGGLLTGKHSFDTIPENSRFGINHGYVNRYWNRENFDAIEKFRRIAGEAGISLVELALRYCVQKEFVTSVILGASRMEHWEANLAAALEGPLPVDVTAAVEEVMGALPVGSRFSYAR